MSVFRVESRVILAYESHLIEHDITKMYVACI